MSLVSLSNNLVNPSDLFWETLEFPPTQRLGTTAVALRLPLIGTKELGPNHKNSTRLKSSNVLCVFFYITESHADRGVQGQFADNDSHK